jgi:hypothetical protein
MKTVMKNFVIYRYTEIFLFAAGLGLFLYFRDDRTHQFWKGFGMTLAGMALVALVADYFAEKRGKVYTGGLISFINKTNGNGVQ